MTRRALVTGGTRGIGAAIAKALKEAGYSVVANYANNHEKAESFKAETGIDVVSFNVGDFDSCAEGVKKAEEMLGGPVEVLVNNAGITNDGMMHKMDAAQWSSVITTNLNSCFNLSRLVIDNMRNSGFGRIVNISSINGLAGQMGQTNYSAAKAGVIGFTKALALESARKGITVNVIAPGYINTEMVAAIDQSILDKIVAKIPSGRLGESDEIARAVLFLADDKAGFINGETLSINGAQYLS